MMIITNEVKELEITLYPSRIIRFVFTTKTNYYIFEDTIYNVLENWECYDEIPLANYLFAYPFKKKRVVCNHPICMTFNNKLQGYKIVSKEDGKK